MEKSFHDAPSSLFFSRNGGWIFDNFPRTREQWNAMLDRGILPDDVILLKDESENGNFLLKRWYQNNRSEIDDKVRRRIEQEAEDRRQKEEAERYLSEDSC